MPKNSKSLGLLRDEDRQWALQQAQRYKMFVSPDRHLGRRSSSDRQRDIRLRRRVQKALDDLVWLINTWPPDQQNRVFSEEGMRKLLVPLLTYSYDRETVVDAKRRAERQYRLASMFMEKGIARCLEKVGEPFIERVERDALALSLTLKKAAVGPDEGVSLTVRD